MCVFLETKEIISITCLYSKDIAYFPTYAKQLNICNVYIELQQFLLLITKWLCGFVNVTYLDQLQSGWWW